MCFNLISVIAYDNQIICFDGDSLCWFITLALFVTARRKFSERTKIYDFPEGLVRMWWSKYAKL